MLMPQKQPTTPAGAYLRELRTNRKKSQMALGKALGYKKDNEVSQFERGIREPQFKDLRNIRKVLELNPLEWEELWRRFNTLDEIPPAIQIPDPPDWFQNYRLGNIEIPVMNLFGSPATVWEPLCR
jgi:transcriptional regulator with XRE-family HTH domain